VLVGVLFFAFVEHVASKALKIPTVIIWARGLS